MCYTGIFSAISKILQWRHNERDGVSNHRCLDGLLNRLFRRRSNNTPKPRVTGLCEGNSPGHRWIPPHKGPVTPNMFLFDDVIIRIHLVVTIPWSAGSAYILTRHLNLIIFVAADRVTIPGHHRHSADYNATLCIILVIHWPSIISTTFLLIIHNEYMADSRFTPGQWETSFQSNAVSHWMDANLESALLIRPARSREISRDVEC